MIAYSAMTTLINERLQSSGTADYTVSEIDNALTYAMGELSTYFPHLVPLTFNLESRTGYDVTAAASSVTDTVKGQFLAVDATDEKRIHNTTRNTYAVVLTQSSTSVITVGMNLMTANDQYAIYNKQCWNNQQIYIGDVPNYDQIHSVEYPIGTKRNWKRYDKILELVLDYVPDSNANTAVVTVPNDMSALVRFIEPHSLPNLTDFAGKMAATASSAATSISSSSWQNAGTINVGTEFTIENHASTYVVTSSATIAANTTAINLYPPLEATISSTAWVITVRQTTLPPMYEDAVADIAVARCMINRAPEFLNSVNIAGGQVYQNFLNTGERRLAETLAKLRRSVPPRSSQQYPRD